jgi:hypothetical protein
MLERRLAPSAGDRRRSQRAPFIASVRQRCGGQVELALAQNLGEHGMELKRLPSAVDDLPQVIELCFELPDGGGVVRVCGTVVFDRPAGPYRTTGVRFASIAPADRARILRFLATSF